MHVKTVCSQESIMHVRHSYVSSNFFYSSAEDVFFGSLCNPGYYFCTFTSLVFCIPISAFLPSEGCLLI